MRQEGVLLALVETVHLVDEHNGGASALLRGLRLRHCIADVLHTRKHRRQGQKIGIESVGHQSCQRGLAHSRRSPEQHGMQPPGFERHPQRLAGSEQMLLADDLVEGVRPQALGQRHVQRGNRRRSALFGQGCIIEQAGTVHDPSVLRAGK
ncbi:hypothetical protein GALL_486610 [mine drainage metagenome]|uniref:Uncharacterized protein n=1 Tax=mine drainage metagenome TaxID=410659 RepID=A0A1J5PDM8_9ZZZZ